MCGSLCRRCLDWVDSQGAREGDTAADRLRRRLLVPLMVVEVVPVTLVVLWELFDVGFDHLSCRHAGLLGIMLIVYFGAPTLLWSPLPTLAVTSAILLAYLVPVLLLDLGTAVWLRSRTWSMCVLLLDACLVFSLDAWVPNVIIAGTVVYLAVERCESVGRWGLYDAGRLLEPAAVPPLCDCTAPPCGGPWTEGLYTWTTMTAIFFADFVMTRYFAVNLRLQMSQVSASIAVAEQVSGSLARFDLDSAGAALSDAGAGLPPGLAGSLQRLLGNLASYRPYLPQSCFAGMGDEREAVSEAPLESPTDEAAQLTPAPGAPVQVLRRHDSAGASSCSTGMGSRGGSIASQRRGSGASTVESSNSSARPSASIGAAGRAPSRLQHQPQHRRVTLLGRNSCGLLAAPALHDAVSAAGALTHWLSAEVDRFSGLVSAQGGVADLLSGDHMSASFGALRAQGTQREGAVRAAVQLAGSVPESGPLGLLPVSTAVCSGRALCGDFGSALTQRFMVVGGVGALQPALERAAAAWRVGALADAMVHGDVEHSWNCILRGQCTFPKVSAKPFGLWEVVGAKDRGAAGCDEWMYELQQGGTNPWDSYNSAVQMWCTGHAAAALAAVAEALQTPGVEGGGAVHEGLRALQHAARSGVAPPCGPLAVAALPAGPAPLQGPPPAGAAAEVCDA